MLKPTFSLHPSVSPPLVKLNHTAHRCCSQALPLICVNQPLCSALDVLRCSRTLESNKHSALMRCVPSGCSTKEVGGEYLVV